MASPDGNLNLQGITSREDLVRELDRAFNMDEIHRLSDDAAATWEEVQNAILSDVRHPTYNKLGLISTYDFVADGTFGFVEFKYASNNIDVTDIVINYPSDTRFAQIIINHDANEPWKIKDIDLQLFQD